jgi:hypothetical protein
LIGGLITSAISWRAAFVFQALVIVVILVSSRRISDPVPADPTKPFDIVGSVLSAAGLVLFVMGILAADNNLWLTLGLMVAGALILAWFFGWIRSRERAGKEALLSTSLFRNRISNLGLITQNVQWLVLLGTSFTVASFLQVVRGYDAVKTGVVFTAATAGLLASSLGAERFARRRAQRTLIVVGFLVTIVGVAVLLIGFGLGAMLTPSVNVVQGSFGESLQGEISGLSRSVSNLGSSFGTAIAGTILVAGLTRGAYAAAMGTLAAAGLIGLGAALMLPRTLPARAPAAAPAVGPG